MERSDYRGEVRSEHSEDTAVDRGLPRDLISCSQRILFKVTIGGRDGELCPSPLSLTLSFTNISHEARVNS